MGGTREDVTRVEALSVITVCTENVEKKCIDNIRPPKDA